MEGEKNLITVAYVSSATRMFTSDELAAILDVSRERNTRDDITGMLIYSDGNFIQVLEGPEARVRDTVERIRKDARHTQFTFLLDQPIGERIFAGWAMGFKNVGSVSAADGELYAALRAGRLQDVGFLRDPARTWHLLKSFANNMR